MLVQTGKPHATKRDARLSCEPEARVVEYRRGIEFNGSQTVWQKLWHFSDKCEAYPTRNFVIRQDKPSDDDLCSRCNQTSNG